ncbi:VOC family protein [Pseudodesulfovibrio sediminis]|uniref:Antibiotic resistance protein n=1 Tax=Pseudodesulfovibrio sediminis TaxID=2810563 RepID=A0ABN6ESU8_9BACT|nr:VOC family protein [Pseudodesulfovibrio sediminis]BCS88229.1 antibiotic resistance protein [Pseudodesulfovibrio sediminis]
MQPTSLSPTIIVKNVEKAKAFYAEHFGATTTFDCGWYVNLELGAGGPTLQFMQPQSPNQPEYQGGLTYNIRLESTERVDSEHNRMNEAGLPIVMPLEDHPWGDRGFCTLDPYGVALYIYADTEPSEEFRQYYV